MTFGEWCDQIARDTESNVTRALVREIMVTAVRTAIEEIITNPADATLDIKGVGRFYLNRQKFALKKQTYKSNNEDDIFYWRVNFKASRILKDVINNKRDIKTVTIGSNISLYNESDIQSNGTVKVKGTRNKIQLVVKPKIREKAKESQKKKIKAKLPED